MNSRELRQRREGAVVQLGAIRRRATELDPRAHLATEDASITTKLTAPLLALCSESAEVLSELSSTFDEHDDVPALCFAARTEVAQSRRGLEAKGGREAKLVACEVARQRLLRSIAAVAGAVERRQDTHLPDEGRAAALVRAMYMRLRAVLEASAEPRALLLRVEAFLEEMRARREYAQVRLADRFLIDGLRERVAAFHASRGDETAPELLSDVRAAVELLAGINQRPDLRAHDLRMIALLQVQLEDETTTRVALVQARELLRGRDPQLDEAFVLATATVKPDAAVRRVLLRALERVNAELSCAPSPW